MSCKCRIANALARSGREWAQIIAHSNSGTYNNQYMVIDLKLFQPGQELQPDLLWVIEQVGLVHLSLAYVRYTNGFTMPIQNLPLARCPDCVQQWSALLEVLKADC